MPLSSSSLGAPTEHRIVEASPGLARAALRLLPELLEADRLPTRLWIAYVAPRSHELLGAAALVPLLHDVHAPGFRCMARVLPSYRRRGFGSALVGRLVREAKAWGVDRLHSWNAHDQVGEGAFLKAMGFEPHARVLHFLGATAPSLALCEQRLRAIQARTQARLETAALHEVDLDAVAALYCSHLGGSPAAVRTRIADDLTDPACRELSVAVREGSRVAGLLLVKCSQGVPDADLWISDPGYRRGVVSMMTLHAALKRCAAMAKGHFRFHCNEQAQATLNFARRSGASLESARHTYTMSWAER